MEKSVDDRVAVITEPARRRIEEGTPNEDSFFFNHAAGIYAVMDGVGGHDGGAQASQLAVAYLRDLTAAAISGDCRISFLEIRDALRGAAEEMEDGGTTLAMLRKIDSQRYDLFWCGDSRIYGITSGAEVRLLTEDDNLLKENYTIGRLSRGDYYQISDRLDDFAIEEELSDREKYYFLRRNQIFNCLFGQQPNFRLNRFSLEPDERFDWAAFMLVTDGITDPLRTSDIARLAAEVRGDYRVLPDRLLKAAREVTSIRRKDDDATCMVVVIK